MPSVQNCGNNNQFDLIFFEKDTSTVNSACTVWFSGVRDVRKNSKQSHYCGHHFLQITSGLGVLAYRIVIDLNYGINMLFIVLEPIMLLGKKLNYFPKVQNEQLGTRLVSDYIFESENFRYPIFYDEGGIADVIHHVAIISQVKAGSFYWQRVSYNCRNEWNCFQFMSEKFSRHKEFLNQKGCGYYTTKETLFS